MELQLKIASPREAKNVKECLVEEDIAPYEDEGLIVYDAQGNRLFRPVPKPTHDKGKVNENKTL